MVTLAVAAVPVPATTKIHIVVCNEKYALLNGVRIFVYNHLDLSTPQIRNQHAKEAKQPQSQDQ